MRYLGIGVGHQLGSPQVAFFTTAARREVTAVDLGGQGQAERTGINNDASHLNSQIDSHELNSPDEVLLVDELEDAANDNGSGAADPSILEHDFSSEDESQYEDDDNDLYAEF